MKNKNTLKNIINIPFGYEKSFIKEVKHDDCHVTLARFKKIGVNDAWGSEHFSFTYDNNKILKGFIHLEENLDTDDLLSERESEEIAMNFLAEHAPDLINSIEVKWIRPLRKKPVSSPHDDGFILSSGTIIIGMRVKLFIHSNEKYGWVIVGKDGKIINFERDIVWDTKAKCRTTEKWLHDSWASQNIKIMEDGYV